MSLLHKFVSFSAQTLLCSLVFKAFSLNHSILSMFLSSSTMFCSPSLQLKNYYQTVVYLLLILGVCQYFQQIGWATVSKCLTGWLTPVAIWSFIPGSLETSSWPVCPQCQFTCSRTPRSNSSQQSWTLHTHAHTRIHTCAEVHTHTCAEAHTHVHTHCLLTSAFLVPILTLVVS